MTGFRTTLPARAAAPVTTQGIAPLAVAARAWFVVTVIGQLLFASYIAVLYGGGAMRGDPMVLKAVMPKGYVPGDRVGNVTIVIHLALALLIMGAGSLQLVPWIRRRMPIVHRVVGRSYITAALLISIGGLYLVWVRGTVGDLAQHLGSTLNAALIMTCGVLAWRAARARDIDRHRRWALRLFLVASGVWFFRVGLMAVMLVFRRPVGFDMNTFTGPFLTALTFGESLLPLAVLQLYLWAQDSRSSSAGRWLVATTLMLLTCGMALGIVGATLGMWLPRMK